MYDLLQRLRDPGEYIPVIRVSTLCKSGVVCKFYEMSSSSSLCYYPRVSGYEKMLDRRFFWTDLHLSYFRLVLMSLSPARD